MAPVTVAEENEQSFTSWLNDHIRANYTFPNHDAALASILQTFIEGVYPVTFCTCPDGTERRFCDGLRFKYDERRLRLEKRYGNGTRSMASGQTIARVVLFNEVVKEVYEREWHTDRFVEISLLPARLSSDKLAARGLPERRSPAAEGDCASQSRCTLLTALPLEHAVRDGRVPAIVVAHRSNTLHTSVEDGVLKAKQQRRPPQALSLVCKQMRSEVLTMFYSDNVFIMPVSTYSEVRSVEQWLSTISQYSVGCLRNVILEYEDGRVRRRISFGLNLHDLTAVVDVANLEEPRDWSFTPDGQMTLHKLQATQYKLEALRRRLEELRNQDPVGVVAVAELMSLVDIVSPQERLWRSFLRGPLRVECP